MEDDEIVTIVCKNDEEITHCKRQELATHCEYFRALLCGHFAEKSMEKIYIRHVNACTLIALLDFCRLNRGRKRKFDDPMFSRIHCEDGHKAAELMQVADMLGMEGAVVECEKYFIHTIEFYHPADLFHLAKQTSSFLLMRDVMRNWKLSCIQGQPNECICELTSRETCLRCLSNRHGVKMKEMVYVIGGYYRENFNECACIELSEFTKDIEVDKIQQGVDSVTKNSVTCPSKASALSRYKYNASYPGTDSEEYRVVALDTDIYLTGGFDVESKAMNQVWKYDTRTNTWCRVSGMRRARFYHCIAAIGQHIYVCGGYDDNHVINTLERYHPHYNEWVDLSDMITGVGNAAYASDEMGIYVCCGQYGYKDIHTTSDVQYYLVLTDQWSVLTAYKSPASTATYSSITLSSVFYPQSEYGMSAAVVGKELFVFGGQTERCDAFNVETHTWRRLTDMNNRRMETAGIVLGGELYSVGGYDYRTGQYHDTTERYDRKTNRWRTVSQNLPKPLRSMGVSYIVDVTMGRT